jgi:hypothetical protein
MLMSGGRELTGPVREFELRFDFLYTLVSIQSLKCQAGKWKQSSCDGIEIEPGFHITTVPKHVRFIAICNDMIVTISTVHILVTFSTNVGSLWFRLIDCITLLGFLHDFLIFVMFWCLNISTNLINSFELERKEKFCFPFFCF